MMVMEAACRIEELHEPDRARLGALPLDALVRVDDVRLIRALRVHPVCGVPQSQNGLSSDQQDLLQQVGNRMTVLSSRKHLPSGIDGLKCSGRGLAASDASSQCHPTALDFSDDLRLEHLVSCGVTRVESR